MNRCFVIGPIGNKLAPVGSPARALYEEALQVFEDVIRPACQANDLDPIRADGIAVPGEITDQIFRHLYEDEVVIADVSGGNPNVMYELGLRHTRKLLTVQLGEFGQLPFDVNTVRTIQFSRSERGLIDARNLLEQTLRVGLADGGDLLSATRIWTGEDVENVVELAKDADAATVTSEDLEEPVDPNEDGLVERMDKIEGHFDELTLVLEEIGALLESLGADAEEFSAQLDTMNATNVPSKQRLTVMAQYGQRLQPPADRLTELTDAFAAQMSNSDAVVKGILKDLGANPHLVDENEFLNSIVDLARSSREGMGELSQFGTMVSSLGSISRTLRKPGIQMGKAIREMADAAAAMDDWEAGALKLQAAAKSLESAAPTEEPKPAEIEG